MSVYAMDPEALLSLPVEDIEQLIGAALLAETFGSKEPSNQEMRATARRWFAANLPGIRSLVCESAVIRSGLGGRGAKDRNTLVGALIDVLGTRYGVTVPVAALAVMIIHFGIERLCPALTADET
jgi:hypothetical protein